MLATHEDYGVQAAVGKSAFGRTYRALRSDGVQVAFKVLSPDAIEELDVEHLRRTCQALSWFDHHAVPRDHRLFEFRGDLVLSREFIDGVDVGSLVAMMAMPPRAAAQIGAEVAGALAAAARATRPDGGSLGLSHGDLRPSCLLVKSDGDVKVTGFGLNRVRQEYADRTLTRYFESLGYMPPERLDGQEAATSDVYSLALCVFTMLTGEIPHRTSANPRRHRQRHLDTVGLLRGVLGREHQSLADLIDESLNYHPDDRPSPESFARRCAQMVERFEGTRIEPWAAEWIPVVRAAHAEVPFQDDGGPISSAVPRRPIGMPGTLSPAPTTRREHSPTSPMSRVGFWLGFSAVFALFAAMVVLASRI